MYTLVLDWKICPDGVEILDRGKTKGFGKLAEGTILPSKPIQLGKSYRYRSTRRFTERYDISNLKDPLVVQFLNARSENSVLEFFSKCGLPYDDKSSKVWGPKDVKREQRDLKKLYATTGTGHPVDAVKLINRILQEEGFALTPAFDLAGPNSNVPRLTLQPQSLRAFMVMEAAIAVANDVRLAECEQCETAFLTGALTGRRSHAKFCSDKCRVAAMRARNKAAAKP